MVARHLKLFPAKCHERATLGKLWRQTGNSSLLPAKCWPLLHVAWCCRWNLSAFFKICLFFWFCYITNHLMTGPLGCHTGVLLRSRNLIPTSAKLHIVKFAITPHLISCQTVWHFCRASDTRKLEQIQERALRSVYCDNVSSYEELLHRASLPTLYTQTLQDIAIMTFKVKNGLAPPYITDLFVVSSTHYNLRNSDFMGPLHMSPLTGTNFVVYSYGKLQPGRPGWNSGNKTKMVELKLVSFATVVAFWTLVTWIIKLIRIFLNWTEYIQDKNYAILAVMLRKQSYFV